MLAGGLLRFVLIWFGLRLSSAQGNSILHQGRSQIDRSQFTVERLALFQEQGKGTMRRRPARSVDGSMLLKLYLEKGSASTALSNVTVFIFFFYSSPDEVLQVLGIHLISNQVIHALDFYVSNCFGFRDEVFDSTTSREAELNNSCGSSHIHTDEVT